MEISDKQLEALRKPFEAHQISMLPKPYKKDSPKGDCNLCGGYHGLPAAHLDYVGHAALTDRLLSVDLAWDWEPLAKTPEGLPLFDKSGGLWIKLTVCGVTRLGYGNAVESTFKEVGSREKEVIGDALRNAAMRFGAALDLWHKGELHPPQEQDPAPVAHQSKQVANEVILKTQSADLNITKMEAESLLKSGHQMGYTTAEISKVVKSLTDCERWTEMSRHQLMVVLDFLKKNKPENKK